MFAQTTRRAAGAARTASRRLLSNMSSMYGKNGDISASYRRRMAIAAGVMAVGVTGFALSVPHVSGESYDEFIESSPVDNIDQLEILVNRSTLPLDDMSPPKYASAQDLERAIQLIKESIGADKVTSKDEDLESHRLNTAAPHHNPSKDERPAYVIFPNSTEDVSEILKVAYNYRVPIVPYSAGTSLEGHIYSVRKNGISLDMSRMNKIIAVHEDDLDVVVQPGVAYAECNQHLAPMGLMLGSDCAPSAQLGGMINTNASGINAAAFGAMRDNTVSLTVVLADGTIIKTRQRPRKTSAGYNLTNLFVGSEGTLGIVTEATIKCHVKPKFERVIVAQFPEVVDTANTTIQILRSGMRLNAIELLDSNMMSYLNYSGATTRKWLEVPTLFMKVGGINETVVSEYVREVEKITKKNNCQDFIFAQNSAEADELFSARKNAHYACLDYGYNEIGEEVQMWGTDVAVPLSKLSTMVEQTEKDFKERNLTGAILGHVGDSNFHTNIFYLPQDEEKVTKAVDYMVRKGLELEGTCTGEHGVGIGKRQYLELELGFPAVDMMRKIKIALDPRRILNPDKVMKIDPNDRREH
ncbi:hypothetical protein V1511DRAFT_492587 [Dipodascopsis uninucleata]